MPTVAGVTPAGALPGALPPPAGGGGGGRDAPGLAGGLHPGGLADFPPGLGVAGGERARGVGRPPAEDDEALELDDADAVWGVVAVCNLQYLGGGDP